MLLRGMCLAVPVLVGACGFQHGALTGDAATSGDDSGSTVDIDAPLADASVDTPAGQLCIGSPGSLLLVCYQAGTEPTQPYLPVTAIDTNANCDRVVSQASPNPELCIKQGTSIAISANLRVTGPRPLVLVSTSSITISGSLDLSSGGAGAQTGACNDGNPGNNESSGGSSKGGGGGGGGGFGTGGGAGGAGSAGGGGGGGSAALNAIRGGCRGGTGGSDAGVPGGVAGSGGGAVYLMAATSIDVPGTIKACGGGGHGGGHQAGGGGGGAGGLIGFDAPSVVVAGSAFANGGGGGEGGDSNNNGEDGNDTTQWNAGGRGGNAITNGGDGGTGAFITTAATRGADGNNGGGGGGGGAGRIRRFGGTGLTGKISPPAP